ncbi:MAG: hypothetical protein Kow0079_09620 [Vicingaceae bacterium]
MKKSKFISLVALFLVSTLAFSQKRTIPEVQVQTVEGEKISTSTFNNDGKPMIINFWATWCSPCKRELNNIADVYDDWVEETGVKLIAVSIDDSRNMHKVGPYVNAKGWEFEVYVDPNNDFRRAIGFQDPPFTCLIDGEGNIVYTHTGYQEGDEENLYEMVKKLAAGEKISEE